MVSLSELEEWLNDLRDLIFDIHICVANARRITIDKYENEDKLKKEGFFRHYQLQQIFIISIQLCKILTENHTQKRNVHKLFRTIEKHEFDNDQDYVIKSEINRLRILIDEHKLLIEKVKEVRDQAYAHYDPNRVEFGPTLLEYQTLVDLSAEIYNGIHLKHFGSSKFFRHTIPWEIDQVIRMAAKNLTDVKVRRSKSKLTSNPSSDNI